jgi:hypothetical protein
VIIHDNGLALQKPSAEEEQRKTEARQRLPALSRR